MARPRGFRINSAAMRAVMTLQGLNMTQVAERSGKGLTTISGLMQADHRASAATARAVAEAVGVPIEAIFPEAGGKFAEVDEVAGSAA
jgi:transcriptional regulator with XRE-family HTH domain